MLLDRFGNALSTSSAAARDAYVEGCDLMFTLWTGADEAFACATAEDPNFALAHVGTAQVAAFRGDGPAMRAALSAAQAAAGLSSREVSQIAFFGLRLSGQSLTALAAARIHLGEWPRDAVVMNHYGPILGLINDSGRPGNKREQAIVMDSFARHYGDDWWYVAHHAMALSEVGRTDEARSLAERSLAANPRNFWAAHSRAHVAYEGGEEDGARGLIDTWLPTYPREAPGHGHIAWHLAIAELAAGNQARAFDIYTREVAPGSHLGVLRLRAYDCIQFVWRWELAGNARDPEHWQAIAAQAHAIMPHATTHFPDIHVALADAVTGNTEALQTRTQEMETLIRVGRYPEGGIILDTVRGLAAFARGDYKGAIDLLSPLLADAERIGGSRAQEDLVEFTVFRACIEEGRRDELQRLLAARRAGPSRAPVAGLH